jgi:hypothetical protein
VEGCPTTCAWQLNGSVLSAPGTGQPTNYFITSQPISVVPGEVLQFGVNASDKSTTSTATAYIQLDDTATGYTTTYASAHQSMGASGVISNTYTVGAGITSLRISLGTSDATVPVGSSDTFSAPYVYAISGAPTPAPTSSPSPAPGAPPAATLCIGSQLYNLTDYDNFAADAALSVTDNWPPTSAQWSNQFYFGRTNNAGLDLALYPSQAQMSALWPTLAPVAKLIPGVGLDLHAEPVPMPTTAAQHTALCSNGDDTTCRTYLSGMLSKPDSYVNGYWVYRAMLPSNNSSPNSWWPAVWTFNNTPTAGPGRELDDLENWPGAVLGSNVVQQTEQCYSPCSGGGTIGYRGVLASSQTAMNDYGSISTGPYVGFYINEVPTSTQMVNNNASSPLAPILSLQVNGAYGVTPGPGATADLIVAWYAYYQNTGTACQGGMATPAPSATP